MMTHDDQRREYDRMRMSALAEREMRIRELALTVSQGDPLDPTGHRGPTNFAIHQPPRGYIPPGVSQYCMLAHTTITVDLHPALMGTQEGVLIAETMIRDAWDCAAEGVLDR